MFHLFSRSQKTTKVAILFYIDIGSILASYPGYQNHKSSSEITEDRNGEVEEHVLEYTWLCYPGYIKIGRSKWRQIGTTLLFMKSGEHVPLCPQIPTSMLFYPLFHEMPFKKG